MARLSLDSAGSPGRSPQRRDRSDSITSSGSGQSRGDTTPRTRRQRNFDAAFDALTKKNWWAAELSEDENSLIVSEMKSLEADIRKLRQKTGAGTASSELLLELRKVSSLYI